MAGDNYKVEEETLMKTFLAGLGIGVGLGVLFAPETGEATRRKLRERFAELVDNGFHTGSVGQR